MTKRATESEDHDDTHDTTGDPRCTEGRKARLPSKNVSGPLRDLASLIASRLADDLEAKSTDLRRTDGGESDRQRRTMPSAARSLI